jgi:GTP-binding protein
LQRTRLLLHIVDVLPLETDASPVEAAQKILVELRRYDEDLYHKSRWLVLNKVDLVSEDERQAVCDEIVSGLDWNGPVYQISALNKQGVDALCNDIMLTLESNEQAAL